MYKLIPIKDDLRIFLIVDTNDLTIDENSLVLPMIVYGLLQISGNSYQDSTVSYSHISDKLTHKELERLSELAKFEVWQMD